MLVFIIKYILTCSLFAPLSSFFTAYSVTIYCDNTDFTIVNVESKDVLLFIFK